MLQLQDEDLITSVQAHYCDIAKNANKPECIKHKRRRQQSRPTNRRKNGNRRRKPKRNRERNRKPSKRSVDSYKPMSAVHLSNISTLVPEIFIPEDIHIISQRSILYNPKSKETLNAFAYASPWAAMVSYNPRNEILKARSNIANLSEPLASSKFKFHKES